jgi:hypothetical protein
MKTRLFGIIFGIIALCGLLAPGLGRTARGHFHPRGRTGRRSRTICFFRSVIRRQPVADRKGFASFFRGRPHRLAALHQGAGFAFSGSSSAGAGCRSQGFRFVFSRPTATVGQRRTRALALLFQVRHPRELFGLLTSDFCLLPPAVPNHTTPKECRI